jgi:hypothetical protein
MTEGHVADDTARAPRVVAWLQLDETRLPVYELEDFNASDIRRVTSFSSNFGSWALPRDVARALGMSDAGGAALEWIHDTGELVLLGGEPTVDNIEVDVSKPAAMVGAVMPGFLDGTAAGAGRDKAGNVRELFKTEVMPPGTRVALLAHLKHGPKAHELLWGWHREHRRAEGWSWLVERLATLDGEPADSANHLA